MERIGYIKLNRKILDNPIFKKSTYFHLWSCLLLLASHKPNKFMWNGDVIIIKEGQFITGRKQLSEYTNIPESTIEDILKYLERQHQIQQQKTTKFRLITIVNWEKYQGSNSIPNNKATTKQQQADTINNDKNNKNDNKEKIAEPNGSADSNHKEIVEVIEAFKEINPSYRQFFGNKTQRGAALRMFKLYGSIQSVKEKINWLKQTNQMPFAPVITTPKQFEDKLAALIAFINKENNKK